jgi:RNA polymerase sigma-70 factor (ECF subfamily)
MSAAPDAEPLPVAAARTGDARAWDRLIRRYQRPLFSFVNALVRQEATSLDLVQETFVRAIRHLPALRDDGRFGSWLFGIAHQLCALRARRSWREEELGERLADAADESLPAPGEMLMRDEDAAAVFELLAELPAPQRAALTLHVLEDFSLEEIAAVTGAPVGTVKSRLHHAKRALRERLGDTRTLATSATRRP